VSAALQVFLVEITGREGEGEGEGGCGRWSEHPNSCDFAYPEVEFRSKSVLLSHKTLTDSKAQVFHSQYSKVWYSRRLGSRLSASGSKPHLRFPSLLLTQSQNQAKKNPFPKKPPSPSTASKLKRPSPHHAILHQPIPSPPR